MKRNTVASMLIALILAAVAVPAFAADADIVDPDKPTAACAGQ